nr:PREDICTED: uncharacterized protein LOC105663055 isoform X2 [Megachile rotundata]
MFSCYRSSYTSNTDDTKKRLTFSPAVHVCLCRNNEKCYTSTDCSSLVSSNSAMSLEPCQCAEEIMWNCNTPPKPGCKWFNNFSELRRQWSNHARRQNCRCCNCKLRAHSVKKCRLDTCNVYTI